MNIESNETKGLSGLANLGNTCFINSCMQVLSHTEKLNELIDSDLKNKINNKKESLLLIEWIKLKKLLWNKNSLIAPNRYIKAIQFVAKNKNIDLFTGYSQNDLPEFLIFTIDCFHNSISRKINMNITGKIENNNDKLALKCFEMIKNIYEKDYSEIWNLFYAVQVTEIRSKEMKTQNLIPEPYFILNLPIPEKKSITLLDCFDKYIEDELLEGENSWYNENTKQKEDVFKRTMFWSFPTILVIDLKRFKNSNVKLQNLIYFPIEDLDLSSYLIGYNKDKECKYDLYGVCNHSGGVLGGHYTSYIKVKNEWYHFNDTDIKKIDNPNSVITTRAYCLFYKKRN
jgi:ubiquitin carboxyl-terminal hydrolase 8